jgi:hypothetical protein
MTTITTACALASLIALSGCATPAATDAAAPAAAPANRGAMVTGSRIPQRNLGDAYKEAPKVAAGAPAAEAPIKK